MFKCARCACFKDEKEFGKKKNKERTKTCLKCIEYKEKWYEERDEYNFKLDKSWKAHPIYKNYYCDELGHILNKRTKKLVGTMKATGYIAISTYNIDDGTRRHIRANIFIWETLKGKIPENYVINHINEIKHDNRICNLECVTKSENSLKATQKSKEPRTSKKCSGINQNTKEEFNFKSHNDAERKTGCNHVSVMKICTGITNSATSKTTGDVWIFKYI